jgi:lipopolysaccharide transport system ATP-binding protein
MTQHSIRAENLGKRYQLGACFKYKALRDTLADSVKASARALRGLWRRGRAAAGPRPGGRTFWALREVGFEIQAGEVVGIIGRNGAGKSTLLKILSRITEPTTGSVDLYGRVGSLLEVGTGFHPELTGRENVYLNGAILGMKRAEIRRKFDEIVAFAEVEKFLDTPIRHYSSGMYMRLAFAVAAHLEPEILLVDEVLAVGDASFQRKCLNKMEDVGSHGRTVLFVSHNMPAVTRLCKRVILLDGGQVVCDGPAAEVAALYLRSGSGSTAVREWPGLESAPGNDVVRLRAVRVRDEGGAVIEVADIRRPVGLEMEYDVLTPGHALTACFEFVTEDGVCAFWAFDQDPAWRRRPRPAGRYVSTAWVPGNYLSEGTLMVGAAVSSMDPVQDHVYEREAVAFQVVDNLDGDSARGDYAGPLPGVVRPMLGWSTRALGPEAAVRGVQAGVGDG